MSAESLGTPIAVGRTAEVYPWHDGQVLKLFREWCPRRWVDYELHIARIVQAGGLPVPAVGDIVEVAGRLGIVYEQVIGPSMLYVIKARPWALGSLARQFARLHVAIHALTVANLPLYKDRLARDIQSAEPLPAALKAAALERLEILPDGDRLCHGDFHPDNIIMTQRGPIVIDWMTAARGHPLADVSRTCLLLASGTPAGLHGAGLWLLNLIRRRFARLYLQEYLRLRPDDRSLLKAWHPVIAAARLCEDIPEEREHSLAVVKEGLR